jgi:hypothetical protein
MLVLIKTKDGVEKAINLENAEFEAKQNPNDASSIDLVINKKNGETIEATISEEAYRNLIDSLQGERKLLVL